MHIPYGKRFPERLLCCECCLSYDKPTLLTKIHSTIYYVQITIVKFTTRFKLIIGFNELIENSFCDMRNSDGVLYR